MADRRIIRRQRRCSMLRCSIAPSLPSVVERLESRLLLSTYTVTNLNDSGPGSLRDAIEQTNTNPGPDAINFASGLSGTITLGGTQLEISRDLTIDGPGIDALTVDGNNVSRVFLIDPNVTAWIKGITITGGYVNGSFGGGILNGGTLTLTSSAVSGSYARTVDTGGGFISGNGGGISNDGTLTVTNSTISGNSASDAYHGSGGGIYNEGSATVTNSTVSGNSAGGAGGGVFNSGSLTLSNTIVSGNSTIGDGGGIVNDGGALTITSSTVSGNSGQNEGVGISNGGTFTLTNSTVSGNQAYIGGGISNDSGTLMLTNTTVSENSAIGGDGGGILNSGTLTLTDSIVVGNRGGSDPGSVPDDISGGPVDALQSRNDLIGSGGSGGLANGVNGNIVGVADPKLAPLGDYGGPTMTMPPLPGSPAIDAGSNALALGPDGKPLVTDQRGYARYFNGTVDIGAVEYGSAPLQPGDANGDGKVDFADLVILARNFGKTSGVTWADGDFNGDGQVDFDDLVLLARHYSRPLL